MTAAGHLLAAARILTALADAIDAHENWIPADYANVRAAADDFADGDPDDDPIAAALLAAARRETQPEPRVWLPGDTVPAGTWVADDGGVRWLNGGTRVQKADGPLIEVPVPGADAIADAVAAELARRAATADDQ